MDKPVSLKIQEFQQNISNVIGESGLPIFMIKYILKDLQVEIDELANQFAQQEISQYTESLNASLKSEENDIKEEN